MAFELVDLPWLRVPPQDFRARCKAVAQLESGFAPHLRELAMFALRDDQLAALAKTLEKVRSKVGGPISGLQPFRLGLISDATTKLISPAISASALRHGLDLTVIEAEFNQVVQAAMSKDSEVVSARPDAILLALGHHAYPSLGSGTNDDASAATAHLSTLREGMRRNFEGTLILQTVACPPESLFGNLDAKLPGTQRARIEIFNANLIASMRGGADLLLDVAGLANSIGTYRWFDPVQWLMAKLPFAQRCVPIYAEHCARLCAAQLGKARKCLVLDLDNTMWGGVIGDDGMDGIVLGQGSAVGEAFLAIQQMALDLRERGVVLAVSSKNEDHIARAVFKDHPDMLIREDHLAVFQANWKDKASNLEAIAQTLNIGIDALVLIDDNPAERAQVRQALPQVAVPELGEDPSLYPRHVFAGGYFEAVAFSDEDRQRARQYQANAKRVSMQGQARDLESYLASLEMVMRVASFDSVGRSRISQLINKSNQFNLTTKRYSEAAIAQLEGDPDALTFQIRLTDVFGDNGMICVVILKRNEVDWDIDTWLMSCRVLGRKVEETTLNAIVDAAKRAGGRRLIGTYCPTERNQMVADHYRKLGFEPLEARPDGSTIWALDIASYRPKEVQVSVT